MQPFGAKTAGTMEQYAAEVTTKTDQSSSPHPCKLPDKPLLTIDPGKTQFALNLNDLWAYRELLYFLTWRDVKVRYKQTVLGVLWAIVQPLLTMMIFTFFFGRLAGLEARTDGIHYALFAYAGLLPWTFFANAVTNSGNSLINSAHLITKVYFPRLIIPGAAVAAGVVDSAVAFVMMLVLMVHYRIPLTLSLLLLPLLMLLTILLALGVGMWLSALNVKYRDIRFALPFLIQLWMFVSPVIYPSSIMPEKMRWMLALNPLTGIIESYRSSLFGRPFNWTQLGASALITSFILIYASYSFRRVERSFADIV